MLSIEDLSDLPMDAGHAMKQLISGALVEWHHHLDEKTRIQHYDVYQTAIDRARQYSAANKKNVPQLGNEKSKNIMAIIQYFTDIQKSAGSAVEAETTRKEIRDHSLQPLIDNGRTLIASSSEFVEDHRMELLEKWENFQINVHAGGSAYRGPGVEARPAGVKAAVGHTETGDCADGPDRVRIQNIINTMREIVVTTSSIREDHRIQLLTRLENIQTALHFIHNEQRDINRPKRENPLSRWINAFF